MRFEQGLLEEAMRQSASRLATAQKRGVTDIKKALPFDPDADFMAGVSTPKFDMTAAQADAEALRARGYGAEAIAAELRNKYGTPGK